MILWLRHIRKLVIPYYTGWWGNPTLKDSTTMWDNLSCFKIKHKFKQMHKCSFIAIVCTEARFASLLSLGFTTMSVINRLENKLANRTSVGLCGLCTKVTFLQRINKKVWLLGASKLSRTYRYWLAWIIHKWPRKNRWTTKQHHYFLKKLYSMCYGFTKMKNNPI